MRGQRKNQVINKIMSTKININEKLTIHPKQEFFMLRHLMSSDDLGKVI